MKKLMILLLFIAMVGAFTTAASADVDLYGSARFRSYYTSNAWGTPAGVNKDRDLEWRMGLLSRFGANFKSEKITGKFELDARPGQGGVTDNIESSDGSSKIGAMRLRFLWGQWDFGAGKLMIGHNFPLYDAPASGINYYSGGLQKWGGVGHDWARTSQLRLTFGDFRLAFMQTDTTETSPSAKFEEINVRFPRIEARYDMKRENYSFNFIGGWQTYEIEDRLTPTFGPGTEASKNINSYVLAVRGRASFGPLFAGLCLTYRQNGDNYGAWTVSFKEKAVFEGNDLKNATAWGLVASLGWKINDTWFLEASHATLNSKQDTSLDNEDDAMVWAILARMTVVPGVYIIPELIYQDNKDLIHNGIPINQGDATVVGVYWRIDFK